MSEVACLDGNYCFDTFQDPEKFHDSIDNVKLIRQASLLTWDPVALYMSLLVHLSPRGSVICGETGSSRASPFSRPCGSSNSQARAPLYSMLQDLHSRFPVQIGQQVDDINHHSHGTFFQSLHRSVEATCTLDKGLSALGLTLSQSKSTVV